MAPTTILAHSPVCTTSSTQLFNSSLSASFSFSSFSLSLRTLESLCWTSERSGHLCSCKKRRTPSCLTAVFITRAFSWLLLFPYPHRHFRGRRNSRGLKLNLTKCSLLHSLHSPTDCQNVCPDRVT